MVLRKLRPTSGLELMLLEAAQVSFGYYPVTILPILLQ
jgi:hypothetical protein